LCSSTVVFPIAFSKTPWGSLCHSPSPSAADYQRPLVRPPARARARARARRDGSPQKTVSSDEGISGGHSKAQIRQTMSGNNDVESSAEANGDHAEAPSKEPPAEASGKESNEETPNQPPEEELQKPEQSSKESRAGAYKHRTECPECGRSMQVKHLAYKHQCGKKKGEDNEQRTLKTEQHAQALFRTRMAKS